MAAKLKIFQKRPVHIRHNSKDEFAHMVRGADLGLGGISTGEVPPITGTLEQQANPYKGGSPSSAESTRQVGVAALRAPEV